MSTPPPAPRQQPAEAPASPPAEPPPASPPAASSTPGSDPFAVVADAVDGMRDELAALGDQFRRRLLNDREVRRSVDGLLNELNHARKAAEGRITQPLLYDLILLVDRIEGQAAQDDALTRSVATELLTILERYGMTRVPFTLGPFDPETQEAVEVLAAPTPERRGDVAELVRHGYRTGERLVRPQQVRVYTDR
ncbi:nucleotide exchange factor GrpE [Streptomyces sp. NPDC101166]|uniref:nucleotide exchange factor GrpE n=1 Tax=Streptomyces sp. NPDC101166 TaxID=3366120 RepID=UPI0038218DDC